MANQILEQTNLFSQTKKKCSICKELKSIKEFGKRSSAKDGLHTQCRKCRAISCAIYHEKHKVEISARSRKRSFLAKYNLHVSQTEKICYKCKRITPRLINEPIGLRSLCEKCAEKSKQNDKNHKKRYAAQYRQTHKKEIALQKSQYNETEQGRAAKEKGRLKYRALKLSAEYEDFFPSEIFERDNYTCQLCGKKTRPDFKNPYHPLYPNLDHIVPLSKGGSHTRLNTQCLCFQCNAHKHNNKAGDQLRMFS